MTTTYPDKPSLAPAAAALDDYQTGWESRDAALLRRIAELEKSARPATLFGSSRPEAVGRQMPLVRSYLGPDDRPESYTDKGTLAKQLKLATDAVILSWKSVPGQWLDDLLLSMGGLGLTVYGCQNHEPFDNFAVNPADYHARWDTAEAIMGKHSHVVPTTILDGSHPDSWETFYRPMVPVAGMDRYNAGIQAPKSYVPPADVFGQYLTWADAKGKRKLIAETGTGLVKAGDEAGRLAWARDAHVLLAQEGVEAAAWWYQGGCTIPTETFAAWLLG